MTIEITQRITRRVPEVGTGTLIDPWADAWARAWGPAWRVMTQGSPAVRVTRRVTEQPEPPVVA